MPGNPGEVRLHQETHRRVPCAARENEQLAKCIQGFFEDSHGTYGSPRIYKDLLQAGYVVGENRVARIMRLHKIHAQRAYRKPRFRKASVPSRLFANHLNREFSVAQPNRVWATDTTYIRTLQGWLFLTVVMDLYSRMVMGWAMRTDNHRDGPMDALFMAVKRRKPTHSVLIHSDQGSQFASDDWARLCKALKLEPSMSRRGNCWDTAYRTVADAKSDVFDYIEGFYNRKRRHSTLGQLSPLEFETKKQAV